MTQLFSCVFLPGSLERENLNMAQRGCTQIGGQNVAHFTLNLPDTIIRWMEELSRFEGGPRLTVNIAPQIYMITNLQPQLPCVLSGDPSTVQRDVSSHDATRDRGQKRKHSSVETDEYEYRCLTKRARYN